MKILLINEWTNSVIQNLIHPFAEYFDKNKNGSFHWTGIRWYNHSFFPLTFLEQACLIEEPHAFTNLQNGFYDAVIYGDGGSLIFLSSHLKSTRIIIDSLDYNFIPLSYWNNSELYFKCQLPNEKINIKNKTEFCGCIDRSNKKIYPTCLGLSFKMTEKYENICEENIHDVFFLGSAYPPKRAEMVSIIKNNPNIKFYGGLFNRKDLIFNCVIPENLIAKQLNTFDFVKQLKSSKIILSCTGNGYNCFRQYEALAFKKFLLVQKSPVSWGIKEPEDGKHCVFFEEDMSDLLDKCEYYLNHEKEREEIAQNGYNLYMDYYSPKQCVNQIIQIFSSYKNNNII